MELAHEIGRDLLDVQLVVAVDRYEEDAACQVGYGQVNDEERGELVVLELVVVDDEHEHVAHYAHEADHDVLQYDEYVEVFHHFRTMKEEREEEEGKKRRKGCFFLFLMSIDKVSVCDSSFGLLSP